MRRSGPKVHPARAILIALLILIGSGTSAPRAGAQMKAAAGDRQVFIVHPSITGMTADGVIARMTEHNRLREARLRQYAGPRTYQIRSEKGKVLAEARVLLQYQAPSHKEFKTISETGSGLIRNRVFKPLMESEVATAAGRNRHDSSISPDNYNFELLGEEDIDGHHCFAVQASPKRNDKYLFRAKIWIHATDYAVVRIAGQPAQNPSMWIKRVDFVRRYQKVGDFWLPLRDESVSQVRMFGKNTLTIDYDRYEIGQAAGAGR
ncbi:MAG TPA: outer membrane lipoprotein-sorting protein [Blastocatellia bacterium]|nr:outer membrane lipoprotein-sorting protein [Blastocatellia bacterium]